MPKITKTAIDNLVAPASGDAWLWDSELQGFGVRIQSSGRKTYVVRYRRKEDGKQRKMNLCRVSDATPDKARSLARDVFLAVAAGGDPAGERVKEKTKNEITLEAMFEARVAFMKSKNIAMTSEVERVLLKAKHNAADSIGRDRAPGSVTPDDIIKFVSKHYLDGNRGAADKARSYLRATFEWAITSANDYTVKERKDWGVTTNPAAAVAKDTGARTVRDRNLSAEEIRTVWFGCQDGNFGFSEGTEILLRTLIACGQRVQETLRIEGHEIDLDAKLWMMPKEKTKGGKYPHDIPLPDVIIPDLKRLKDKYGDGYLFPARSDSADEILGAVSVSHAVRRAFGGDGYNPVIEGMDPFTPRDLRRTWKSRAKDAGIDRFTRDLIQQHAQNDTGSKHYDRADYMPEKRAAMEKWSAWLDAILNGSSDPVRLAA
ncbi:tyrosine-type recombinase/integrase [Klebsiella pneumoniae]|uniref:tyrosine-type recombinase/integrase n=1 Tax=Klebsiella pneumoniae TaxID=573 RepID=UPI0034D33DE4